jgi:hypothetical protein
LSKKVTAAPLVDTLQKRLGFFLANSPILGRKDANYPGAHNKSLKPTP